MDFWTRVRLPSSPLIGSHPNTTEAPDFHTIENCDSVKHSKENLRKQILGKRARRSTFLDNRKLRQRETFQGEFAEANSQETCSPEHVFRQIHDRYGLKCERQGR